MSSTLMTHSSTMKAQAVTYNQLATIPTPEAMGPRHKPVPHLALVDAMLREADNRGFNISKSEYAVAAGGAVLFGVLDLVSKGADLRGETMGLSLGFRSGNDQSMAIKVVAGQRVFVCDNLALSGDLVAMVEKHTTGLVLVDEVKMGFDRYLQQTTVLVEQVKRLQVAGVTDERAKALIFDIFAAKVVPSRLLDDVAEFYFQPSEARPDCQPRTMWGLHNAFTRAMKQLRPMVQFNATVAIGRRFGMTSGPVIDAQVVNADNLVD